MKHYSQLAHEQRYQIEALMKAGNQQKEITDILGVSASTISRELKRGIQVSVVIDPCKHISRPWSEDKQRLKHSK